MSTDATLPANPLALPPASYEREDAWRAYAPFFPASMRLSPETQPVEGTFAFSGLDVHLDRYPAPRSPFKIVVLHGVGAYGRVMAPAAVIARRHGYEAVCPDLPGYGLTEVPRSRLTYDLWVECTSALVEAELARDGRPVVLFGVSLGGLLAYQVAARVRRVAGLVATTLADLREPDVRRAFSRTPLLGTAGAGLLRAFAPITDGVPIPLRWVSKMHRISNDPALSAVCVADRRGGGNVVPARFLRTMLDHAPALDPEAFDVCPVLLAHPGADGMTEIAHSRRFFDRLAADKRMVVLEGASHMPTEHPGVDQLEAAVLQFLGGLAGAR